MLGAATLIGALAAILTFFPRLTISNTASIDSDDPFSTPFLIINDGYLPLSDVQFALHIRDLETLNNDTLNIGTVMAGDYVRTLWPGDGYSYYAGRAVSAHRMVKTADVDIVVIYQPFALPINRERSFRFVTQMGPDNRLHWMQRPG